MRRLFLAAALVAATFSTGCATLKDAVAGIQQERRSVVEAENVRATVVAVAGAAEAGDELGQTVFLARLPGGLITPVICGADLRLRCESFSPDAQIWINRATWVGCAVTRSGVVFSQCLQPADGEIRRSAF